MEKLKRIKFVLIAIPIIALILIFGNKYIVDVLCSIIAIIALTEYFSVTKKIAKPIKWIGYLLSIAIAFIHVIPSCLLMLALFAIPIFLIVLFAQVIITDMKYTINDIAITLLGICYVIGLIIFIPLIYGMENGKILIWYVFLAAWGTDTLAYFIGMKIGKHKFTKISPKKSIEGCIAGIVGAVTALTIYTIFVNLYSTLEISYIYIILISIALSIFGQLGDLAASTIKRYVEVKDFSNLIPGHGGMLDRIDSIMFIAPIAYVLLMII